MAEDSFDNLVGLTSFVRAADACSFVAAGRLLGISASAVGKNVAKLETQLGVRLFHRSTRHIRLTAEGEIFCERARRILDDLADARAMMQQSAQAPQGRLRVSLPVIGYRFLLPHLPEFSQRYPAIELDLDFNDHLVDVIEDGLDVAIRSGELADSGLLARRLGPFRLMLLAAPAYLAQHGMPATPNDLADHACLRFRFPSSGKLQEWVLREDEVLTAPSTLVCNNMEAMREACIAGLGVAYMPDFLVRDALSSGALSPVLAQYGDLGGQFWMLWPASRQLSPKLRAFVDFMAPRLLAATE
ncbi:DNA-binding transcriptional regulator, LysR family [Rhodoferax sp. OV413]|uniref:LysR family transcriptional regulator n=1 Tax=Rhodoferax sp. OV413 TaxID=1855285 RepID=UPI00087F6584|nr:LysR family transcriptional regulator [Rhodoferax sp. OV413]SDP62172.1 DNA-binding transcriptional regulator, LysR family [Rhodoferax sp. OV413]